MTVLSELLTAAMELGLTPRDAAQGEVVASSGRVSIVLEGGVGLIVPDGSMLAAIAGPGDILGIESLAEHDTALSGIWLTPGRVIEASAADLINHVGCAQALIWMSSVMRRQVQGLAKGIACRIEHSLASRLADHLLALAQQQQMAVVLATQANLALLLGAQRTTICAATDRMKTMGILKVARGKISIRNLDALAAVACLCNGPPRAYVGLSSPASLAGETV